jgi:hypothetical protein
MFFTFLVIFSGSVFATGIPSIRKCGTPGFKASHMNFETVITSLSASFNSAPDATFNQIGVTNVTVPTIFHIVHSGSDGKVPEEIVRAQLDILNKDFTQAKFIFELLGINYIDRPDWFRDQETWGEMQATLRVGNKSTLNIYSVKMSEVSGWATPPQQYEENPQYDGIDL